MPPKAAWQDAPEFDDDPRAALRKAEKRASRKSDKIQVALKQYDKAKLCQDQNRVDSLRAEISTLGLLDHPGIMKFYDAIDSGNKISIVVEYVNGNNLYQYIRKLKG